jgi:hypothetical protein
MPFETEEPALSIQPLLSNSFPCDRERTDITVASRAAGSSQTNGIILFSAPSQRSHRYFTSRAP